MKAIYTKFILLKRDIIRKKIFRAKSCLCYESSLIQKSFLDFNLDCACSLFSGCRRKQLFGFSLTRLFSGFAHLIDSRQETRSCQDM